MLPSPVPQVPFGALEWLLVLGYLLLTTVLGAALAGRQATIRDFFLGGRRLPWLAICGSIVATEISAATLVGVPTLSFVSGGNLTYLQLAIGSILARVIVARYFVPRFYELEIYSPYDYAGARLGPRVKTATTGLFLLGAVLGQGARLYITAFVLSFVADIHLVTAIWIIGAVAVGWTLLGGITTVIWTDVIQFGVMMAGAVLALVYSITAVPGGLPTVWSEAVAAGKLAVLDPSLDLSIEYTLWSGLIAMPFLNLAAFGTDQVMAQRMLCCKSEREARRAVLWSNAGLIVPVIMLAVGIALASYFQHNPFAPAERGRFMESKNYLLPIFVVRALPPGIRAVIVAAIFAAAISTLDGALTALSQVCVVPVMRWRASRRQGRGSIRPAEEIATSKLVVFVWGLVLCLTAMACIAIATQYSNVINLALGLSGYTYGPLLGIFLLAFLKGRRDDTGLAWAVPITLLTVFGMSVYGQAWADWVVWSGVAIILALALRFSGGELRRAVAIVVGALFALLLHQHQGWASRQGSPMLLAFTWCYPIGALMTLLLGYWLGGPQPRPGARSRP